MSTPTPDDPADRLYRLLPAIHRIRDEEQGFPLRDLLRVITEQVTVVEDDIDALYDNWFIETAADWVVPYLGDLVGYRPVSEAGEAASAAPAEVRVLIPRREVADTIRAHRRKGTLALLQELAGDVAGWPARAVEFARLLEVFQHLNHLHPDRGLVVDVHDVEPLERLGGPFDSLAHSVDVRRISSPHRPGRYNVPELGVFIWRLRTYPISASPAACIEEVGPASFTFSVLGNDAPLFTRAVIDPEYTAPAAELALPIPLRRRALEHHLAEHYGPRRSFDIEVGHRSRGTLVRRPVPAEHLVVADLTDWAYRPRRGTVAIDPELGRLAFPPGHPPHGVWVSYRYGFSSDIGGGEYPRRLAHPTATTFYQAVGKTPPAAGAARDLAPSIEEALRRWEPVRGEKPTAIIEIVDSEVYVEQLAIALHRGESLQIRAANRTRPVIYLLDRQRNAPDSLTLFSEYPDEDTADCADTPTPKPGGCFRLDGLMVFGRAVHVEGPLQRLEIRDCTLVPGWGLAADCRPRRPAEPSLEIYLTTADIWIDRSVLGSIQVYADETTTDPVRITLTDSILDATSDQREAIGAPNCPVAHAAVSLIDCTVIGSVHTHAVVLAENSIFTGRIRVARRQIGCMRYSFVPPGSRTPRRHRCQPDLVEAPIRDTHGWETLTPVQRTALLVPEQQRVAPRFTSRLYGTPGYAQLRTDCGEEIVRGADDESEMGAFHDLFQPQRLANLRARLEQFSPARTDIDVVIAN
ncbi:hypothetical protein ACFW9U_26800 [Rhodococcus aetherivorans]|uniref:hypothetical protein n=1 Tax=Rhodococcus aetherivorans TaxID=191292 RepID=UPI00366D0CD9